jgi:hypothetical protein
MILNTKKEIIDLISFNINILLNNYKTYLNTFDIHVINNSSYILTYPEYNIYPENLYTEPNRYNLILTTINNLPEFETLAEFIELIKLPDFNIIQQIVFSKGINRLESLDKLINNQLYLPWINTFTHSKTIKLYAAWIIYNQIFSDGNHRTATYLLDKYSNCLNTIEYISYLRSHDKYYCWGADRWKYNMSELNTIII